jgi:NifU-like protein involved in Fe-S cluster formation
MSGAGYVMASAEMSVDIANGKTVLQEKSLGSFSSRNGG